ncbi:MAG: hypothetical protein F6K09_28290, partial [Merismopedia sp. SIO2A8]|nr:hypothetical protein [Merismopedia sp. SIO2A8]
MSPQTYDLLIRSSKLPGTTQPTEQLVDIGIKDGLIVAIAPTLKEPAT